MIPCTVLRAFAVWCGALAFSMHVFTPACLLGHRDDLEEELFLSFALWVMDETARHRDGNMGHEQWRC